MDNKIFRPNLGLTCPKTAKLQPHQYPLNKKNQEEEEEEEDENNNENNND